MRARSFRRKISDWGVDGFGLFFQGIGIPLLQALVILSLFSRIFPGYRKSIMVPGIVAFSLNFFLVDYLYYWNHRLLHHRILWSTHSVHHSGEIVDVWTTSRNVFWAPLFIIYLWINAFFIYVLKNPEWFLISVALTASLDLWRHSNFGPRPGTRVHFILSKFIMTPVEHHWHHGRGIQDVNFGANLAFWDKFHGTYRAEKSWPEAYGLREGSVSWRKLWVP